MNQTSTNSTRPRRRWLARVFFSIIALLGVSLIVAGSTFMFGGVAGQEFSPETFERRSFLYYQIPLLRIQVTPIWRDDTTNSLENKLRSQKLIPGRSPEKPRWDLVYSMRSVADVTQGDAGILCTYLDATDDEGDLYWQTWTEDHPKLAKILWPAIARVARQQLYFFTPEMIDLARASAADSFQQELELLLARQYRQLGKAQQEIGAHETAVELFDEAISYAPEDADLIRSRDESKSQIESPADPP